MEKNRINEMIKQLYPRDLTPVRRKNQFLKVLKENKTMLVAVCCGLVIPLLMSVFYYNKFVSLYTDATTAQAQVRAYMQKRGNIVVNLTKMVADYAEHEKTMYKYTADIRSGLVTKADMLSKAANGIKSANISDKDFSNFEGVLSKFMAWSEDYPDLKLNANFQDFMREIVTVETSIADARVIFNNKVNNYTTYRAKFPNYFFALMFAFKPMDFYKGNEEFQKFKEVEF